MDEKLWKDINYKKNLSIAFFNATNAAIELAKINGMSGILDPKKFITDTRNWFLEEHKAYYASVISQVGVNYKPEESIAKLKTTTTLEQLQNVWRSLSADERQNEEILKVAKQLRNTYEKTPSGPGVTRVAPVKKGKNNGNSA